MQNDLILSDEELAELDELLCHDISESRTELRHTSDRKYRQRVRRHIEAMRHIRKGVETVLV